MSQCLAFTCYCNVCALPTAESFEFSSEARLHFEDLYLPALQKIDPVNGLSLLVESSSSKKSSFFKIVTECKKMSLVLYVPEDFELPQSRDSSIHFGLEILADQVLIVALRKVCKGYTRSLCVYRGVSGLFREKCKFSEAHSFSQLINLFQGGNSYPVPAWSFCA